MKEGTEGKERREQSRMEEKGILVGKIEGKEKGRDGGRKKG